MVNQTLTDEVFTELEEAVANGLQGEELVKLEQNISSDTPLSAERVRKRDGTAAAQGFTYMVPETEKAQWMAAWRMEVGRDGLEYGRPTKLNIQQIGLHLSRRRESDGGRLFVVKMPERVVPAGRFQCFAVPDQCWKKLSSKGMLLDHIENFHPTAARHLREELETIRKSLNADNKALQDTVKQLAAMDDDPWVATPEEARAESAAAVAHIDQTQGEEKPDAMSMPQYGCALCTWTPDPAKARPDGALRMHIMAKHRSEVE